MDIITFDAETYYSKEYGLGKGKFTIEEYINDSQFQVIGFSYKINNGQTQWVTGTDQEIEDVLKSLPIKESALLCHNAQFDGAILAWRYGIVPKFYLDTLCMARALHGIEAGNSLATLAECYGLGKKGDEVVKAIGKRREDFSIDELSRYGAYCANDTELTYKLFNELMTVFPAEEYGLIDLTIRMFTQPVLKINTGTLNARLTEIQDQKSLVLRALQNILQADTEEAVRKKLASNGKFAAVLKELGITPPVKISPTTGEPTYALAKKDLGFIELCEHPDPTVQQICAARLGVKSTLEESRIEQFLEIAGRNAQRLPAPLTYYAASTGRWGGTGGINLQNLPSRDKDKKALKNSIIAPEDHIIVNADSKQIEARILAWYCGQQDVVDRFRSGADVYTYDAMDIYGKHYDDVTPDMRFVGKTARLSLGYGTGFKKLQHTCLTSSPSVGLSDDEAKSIVYKWRDANGKITNIWKDCGQMIRHMANGGELYRFGPDNIMSVSKYGVVLPNNMVLKYPNIRLESVDGKDEWVYDGREGPTKIWHGTIIENICQALARIVIGWQALQIYEHQNIRPALTVHDSLVYVLGRRFLDAEVASIRSGMAQCPPWAKGLPLGCDIKMGASYGEC